MLFPIFTLIHFILMFSPDVSAVGTEQGFNPCKSGEFRVFLPDNKMYRCVKESALLQGVTDGEVMVDVTKQAKGVPTQDQFFKYYNPFLDECQNIQNPCYVQGGRFRTVRDSSGNEEVKNIHPQNIITTNADRLSDPERKKRILGVIKGGKTPEQQLSKAPACSDYIGDLLFGPNTEGGFCVECNKNTSKKSNPFAVMDEIRPGGGIPLSCFKAAMSDHQVLFSKVSCDEENKIEKIKEPPCITDANAKRISEIFHEGSHCSGMKPDQLFPLFNHESRFVPNAQSGTGASCFGQMIGIAVKEVNRVYGKDKIEEMGRTCEAYKGMATSADPDVKCNILLSPETCMQYSILFQKLLRDKAEKKVSDYESKLKNPGKIADYLSWWGHNGGDSVIQTYFVSYMDSVKKPLSNKEFLDGFATYLGDSYPGTSARKEQVKSFVSDTISDLDKMSGKAGKSCTSTSRATGNS